MMSSNLRQSAGVTNQPSPSDKNVVILDGAGFGDADCSPILNILVDVLKAASFEVTTFPLREMKLAHCLGCFGCWIKTPGMCVEADTGRDIAKAVIQSNVTVLFCPVTFGGYSPELKKMMDRFLQLISPFFQMEHGGIHHPPRYARRPRLIMVGVQRDRNTDEAHIFKVLAGRNAINFHPASYAAEVISVSTDLTEVKSCFEALLTRHDSLPFGQAAASLMPSPVVPAAVDETSIDRHALLIIGSPKTNEPSTSGAIGSFLLNRLEKVGWETESLMLRPRLNSPRGEEELLSAVHRAGLVVLVFPLYVDALPYLVTKALTVIASQRKTHLEGSKQHFVAIVNSGFPETHQNSLALAICHQFAEQSGFTWAGALAFGAGGMIGGEPLTNPKRQGAPIGKVITALELTAASLAEGLPVPSDAATLIAKGRLYSAIWNRLYISLAAVSFRKLAAKNGITPDQLLAQPYATAAR